MDQSGTTSIWISGLWHQGLVAAGVWSDLGFQVIGICDSQLTATQLNNCQLPIFEPGLEQLIEKGTQSGKIRFIVQIDELKPPDYICFMHDTDVDELDNVNLTNFLRDFDALMPQLKETTEILITAQLPAGTSETIRSRIQETRHFDPRITYMPENLRLGEAIERFRNPPLPVFGVNIQDSSSNLRALFPSVPNFETCSLTEAELLKSAMNTFLAIAITFGNEISEISDHFSADGSKVMQLLKLEPRIGRQLPLIPGMPFSGGTLGRDVRNLEKVKTSSERGIIKSIWESNQLRGEYLIKVITDIAKDHDVNTIGLLGLTYKPETSTLRRSFPLEIFSGLRKNFSNISGYDPKYKEFEKVLPSELRIIESLDEIYDTSELLILSTPWANILDYLGMKNIENKFLIDPYGSLKNRFEKEANYFRFGGLRRDK